MNAPTYRLRILSPVPGHPRGGFIVADGSTGEAIRGGRASLLSFDTWSQANAARERCALAGVAVSIVAETA